MAASTGTGRSPGPRSGFGPQATSGGDAPTARGTPERDGARPRASKTVGTITRGTTNANRLRRCDRWLVATQAPRIRGPRDTPIIVDLGFGSRPTTTLELRSRLLSVRSDLDVIGIEIDPARVALAQRWRAPGLDFRQGGFEIPLESGQRPLVIRAFNVLRQYPESEVADIWRLLTSRLAPEGIAIDGTCDELGRLTTWVTLDALGPTTLTMSWRLAGLDLPGVIAQRLPKVLIHHNVPGQAIHRFLGQLDVHWQRAAALAGFGSRQRFSVMATSLRDAGWPLLAEQRRWRLGELTVPWAAIAPNAPWP